MARITLSAGAAADLERLVRTHSLPPDTARRLWHRLSLLERFPKLGPALDEAWQGARYILGPWRWMVIVYVYSEDDDSVVVTTIEDGRSRRVATH